MDMMARMAKGKEVAENLDSQKGHAHQDNGVNPLHQPEFTSHHAQTS